VLTEHDLQELIGFRSPHPVLSVYLHVDPTAGSSDTHKLRLRQMLKDLGPAAAVDAQSILRFVEHEFGWSSRSLALFSCAPASFFRAYGLMVPLRSRARFVDRPYLKPLVDLLDSFGDTGVAVVDQRGVRLFHFHLGELREQGTALGEAVRRVKRGGGSQAAGGRGGSAGRTRHAEGVAERNLHDSARIAAAFFQEQKVRRILLGGTEDTLPPFTALLPKAWQSLVIGTFHVGMDAGPSQVMERAMAVALRVEREREARIADALVTAAAKEREAVAGLPATLSAIFAGQVQTLVFRDGLRAAGWACTGCGCVGVDPAPACPFCGKRLEPIADVVEHAVRRVLAEGGEIDVLPPDGDGEIPGGIGAFLRYENPARGAAPGS
jgi:peptide subunit release factor 1 (eRF1)